MAERVYWASNNLIIHFLIVLENAVSPYINHFLSADTIVPGYANPQALNRYSYVLGNPLKYIDPTGHMVECEDGDVCDHGYPSSPVPSSPSPNNPNDPTDDADDPNPNGLTAPQPSLGLSGGSTQESADNYNYSFGSSNLLLYQYYSWMFDVEITGQFGLIYTNNSPYTIGLDPMGPSLRHTFFQNDGFSLNYNMQPSLGYTQSLPHNAITSVTGINVNPITGAVNSRFVVGIDGPISYQQSVTIKATVRPMETTLAAVAGGVALTYYFFGPVGVPAWGEAARQVIPAIP